MPKKLIKEEGGGDGGEGEEEEKEGDGIFSFFCDSSTGIGWFGPTFEWKKAGNIMIYKYETAWKERRRLEGTPEGVVAES